MLLKRGPSLAFASDGNIINCSAVVYNIVFILGACKGYHREHTDEHHD